MSDSEIGRPLMPIRRMLVGLGQFQNFGLSPMRADDLQSDWKPRLCESTWHSDRRQAPYIEWARVTKQHELSRAKQLRICPQFGNLWRRYRSRWCRDQVYILEERRNLTPDVGKIAFRTSYFFRADVLASTYSSQRFRLVEFRASLHKFGMVSVRLGSLQRSVNGDVQRNFVDVGHRA